MPEGTLFVSVIEEVKTASGDEELIGAVYRLDPDGGVEQVITSQTVIPLAGRDEQVVGSRAYGAVAWWATCAP